MRCRSLTIALIVFVAALTNALAEGPETYVWNGDNGNWWDLAKWGPEEWTTPPLNSDNASVPTGAVEISGHDGWFPATANFLRVSGIVNHVQGGFPAEHDPSLWSSTQAVFGVQGEYDEDGVYSGGGGIILGAIENSGVYNYYGNNSAMGSNDSGTFNNRGLVIWGSLTVGDQAEGQFNHFGGDAWIERELQLGSGGESGAYTMYSGRLLVKGPTRIGGGASGTFLQHNGTASLMDLRVGSGGNIILQDGTLGDEGSGTNGIIGDGGNGTLIQSGGTFRTYGLLLGANGGSGAYHQNGGVVESGGEGIKVGGDAGSSGLFNMTNGQLILNGPLMVGGQGSGQFTQSGGVVSGSGGIGNEGIYTLDNGEIDGGSITVGGSGQFQQNGGSVSVDYISVGGGNYVQGGGLVSTSSLGVHGYGNYFLNGNLLTLGGGVIGSIGEDGNSALVVGGGTITGMYEGSGLIVFTEKGSLADSGRFDLLVTYVSPYFHDYAGHVDTTFGRDSLTSGGEYYVEPNLTEDYSGTQEQQETLNRRAVATGKYNVGYGGGMQFRLEDDSMQPLDVPQITVGFNYEDVQGNDDVPAENIIPNARLFQIGAGEETGLIRNITAKGILDEPAADYGTVRGRSADLLDGYDLVVSGVAAEVRHQNPNIAQLQDRGAKGQGVLLAQLEPGVPYAEHGAFVNWSSSDPEEEDPLRVYTPYGGTPDGHATIVAALMVGYDPLAIEVDKQQMVRDINECYDQGFTGGAPQASLISAPTGPDLDSAIPALQQLVLDYHPLAVNISAGVSENPDGNHPAELAIDHLVKNEGVIVVKSAGNDGQTTGHLTTPAGAYNAIVVGAAQFSGPLEWMPTDFGAAGATVPGFSSPGPTADGRVGVHLVAQGVANLAPYQNALDQAEDDETMSIYESRRGLYSTQNDCDEEAAIMGTSYAAPTVTGVIGALQSLVSTIPDAPLVYKSVLMTSADKLSGWHKGDFTAADDLTVPLDYYQGAGLLNPERAADLLTAGPDWFGGLSAHAGWNLEMLEAEDISDFADLSGDIIPLEDLSADGVFTATLNWYREVADIDGAASALSHLYLALYSWDGTTATEVDACMSPIENLQHLYLDLEGGDYLLRVFSDAFTPGQSEQYCVSWNYAGVAVPEPSAFLLLGMGCFGVTFYSWLQKRRRSL